VTAGGQLKCGWVYILCSRKSLTGFSPVSAPSNPPDNHQETAHDGRRDTSLRSFRRRSNSGGSRKHALSFSRPETAIPCCQALNRFYGHSFPEPDRQSYVSVLPAQAGHGRSDRMKSGVFSEWVTRVFARQNAFRVVPEAGQQHSEK
jgi:hypothetical protein